LTRFLNNRVFLSRLWKTVRFVISFYLNPISGLLLRTMPLSSVMHVTDAVAHVLCLIPTPQTHC